MNKERFYIYLLGFLVSLFILVQVLQPEPVDWSDSFSGTDKIPYGSYITQNLLPAAFPQNEISVNTAPIFEYDTTSANQDPKNWIFLNTEFGLDPWETDILLSEIEKGAAVFIAARQYSQTLADTLNLATEYGNPVVRGEAILGSDTTSARFTNPLLRLQDDFRYLQTTTESFFTSVDSSRTRILGKDGNGNPNFIKVAWGEGNLYLHTNPALFSNFHTRNQGGADYALRALSYLPEEPVIWDEYYKVGRLAGGSTVRYIVSKEHLRWAWILSLTGVVLFMIFKGRREQRIIPEAHPPQNSSIEFARTIGSLYLEKGSHKLIAEKKIQYFLDYIRSHIGLNTQNLNETFKKNLANRSGIPEEDIHGLFDLIELILEKENISKEELTLLTERIDRFYNESQR